jgi:2'-5' RNA ligase
MKLLTVLTVILRQNNTCCIAFLSGKDGQIIAGVTSNSKLSARTSRSANKRHGESLHASSRRTNPSAMYMSSQFDISRPVFDVLSLRSVRGDALIRYDSLNQSEPLRITLFGLFCATFLVAPTFTEAVGYDPMDVPAIAASMLGALVFGGLFVRECRRRADQLSRIAKELNAERLSIRIPTNAFAERPYAPPITLKEIRTSQQQSPPRLIAMCGNQAQLKDALSSLVIYRQRLVQASTLVVAIPTDDSTSEGWQVLEKSVYRCWLADAHQPKIWRDYIHELSDYKESSSFRWFGLTSSGQSWGSGEGDIPQWLQIFGQFLRPADFLDNALVSAAATQTTEDSSIQGLLVNLQSFYQALTMGDEDRITRIYSNFPSAAVTEVTTAGGRIDSWKECLAVGARPEGMKISGADATIISDMEAYTTVVEFPANTGMDSASLLAVQKWTRVEKHDSWKLQLHQTIPWSLETKAQGTLRCDCRGCVALTRRPERRTFGGVIG